MCLRSRRSKLARPVAVAATGWGRAVKNARYSGGASVGSPARVAASVQCQLQRTAPVPHAPAGSPSTPKWEAKPSWAQRLRSSNQPRSSPSSVATRALRAVTAESNPATRSSRSTR